jgi:hypothetical protein
VTNYTLDPTDRGLYAKTLVAATEDRVTITDEASNVPRRIRVETDGSAAVYVQTDGTAAVVGADTTIEIRAQAADAAWAEFIVPGGVTEIRLISSGTPKYTVKRV